MAFELLWHEALPYNNPVQRLSSDAAGFSLPAGRLLGLATCSAALCCRQGPGLEPYKHPGHLRESRKEGTDWKQKAKKLLEQRKGVLDTPTLPFFKSLYRQTLKGTNSQASHFSEREKSIGLSTSLWEKRSLQRFCTAAVLQLLPFSTCSSSCRKCIFCKAPMQHVLWQAGPSGTADSACREELWVGAPGLYGGRLLSSLQGVWQSPGRTGRAAAHPTPRFCFCLCDRNTGNRTAPMFLLAVTSGYGVTGLGCLTYFCLFS